MYVLQPAGSVVNLSYKSSSSGTPEFITWVRPVLSTVTAEMGQGSVNVTYLLHTLAVSVRALPSQVLGVTLMV